MKLSSLASILTVPLIAIVAVGALQKPSRAGTTFECLTPVTGRDKGIPTTYAFTPAGPRPVIRWYSHYFTDAGYSPVRRCQEVTQRFNRLSNSRPGGLDIITTGYLNGLPVVYSPASGGERASESNLLFTLKKGEDAARKVQQLFDFRATGTSAPLYESSAADGSVTIDFAKFLSNTPVDSNVSSGSSSVEGGGKPEQPTPSSSGSSW